MRNFILSFSIILITGTVFAQQIPMSSQYFINPFAINPAFSGNHDNVNAFISNRTQWTEIKGAPQTTYLTIDGPIEDKNMGLGLNIYSDHTDIIGRTGVFANYSYKLEINDDNNLFFGLALGGINNRIDFSKSVIADKNDPFLFTESQSKTSFSADFGLAYTWKKLEVGFSIPQLIGNTVTYKQANDGNSYYTLNRQYQGTIKYVFDVVEDKEITAYPLVMARYSSGSALQYDIGVVGDWKQWGWLGFIYHSNYALAISGGVRYKNLSVGYAYDIGVNNVKSYTGSTSEFLLGYTFGGKRNEVAMDNSNDAVNDELAILKEKADTSQAEIQRLKKELAKLKSASTQAPVVVPVVEPVVPSPPKEREMVVDLSNDFVDDNGMSMSQGFYVIIGTFSSKDNATKFRDANILKGNSNTQITQNHKTKVYNVYVTKIEKLEDAEMEQKRYRASYPDVWIQKLE